MRRFVLALFLFAACTICDHGMRAIQREADADAKRYNRARAYLAALHERRCEEGDLAPCRLTPEIWSRVTATRDEFLIADGAFSLVMDHYREFGVRVASFDAMLTNRQRAVNKMVALADEVRGSPRRVVNQ